MNLEIKKTTVLEFRTEDQLKLENKIAKKIRNKKRGYGMSKTEKGIKKTTNIENLIIHMTDPPSVYGSYSHFCRVNGLKINYNKKLPFEFNGFKVCKIKLQRGTRTKKPKKD